MPDEATYVTDHLFSYPSVQQAELSAPMTNPIEAMLPRHLFCRIFDVFFTYLYPLTPLPCRPAFMQDVASRREERAGEEEWTAMVLGVIAFTVVQVPCDKMGLDKAYARDLVERCTSAVGHFLAQDYGDDRATCERRESPSSKLSHVATGMSSANCD
jgi:hypothetical protein